MPGRMPRYIKLNALKQTLAEDLRIGRFPGVLVLWFLKLIRKRMDFTSPISTGLPTAEFIIQAGDISDETAATLSPLLDDSARLGFRPPVYQRVRTFAGEMVSTVANLRHQDGEMVARVMHIRMGNVHPPKTNVATVLLTQLSDGRRLVTTNQRASYNPLPHLIVQRRIGGRFDALFALHRAALDKLRAQSAPETVRDDSALETFLDRVESEALEANLRRGIYEEVSPEELSKSAVLPAIPQDAESVNETDIAVLAEIEKLQNKRSNWQAGLAFGVLTLAAFVLLGGAKWNWEFVIILTGVVIFHELGHYVAMRLLRFQDVRMFFIPLLGAAVTGRHYNVKGWQRAVVSLAGPVPGILVGLILAVVCWIHPDPLLNRIVLITLIVNGINLLPIVPLDGGWTVNAILFSRHFVLETAFIGFAGALLLGGTALGFGRLWMWLGIAMLVSLPASYKIARLAGQLRANHFPAVSPDEKNIPPATALAILQELKKVPQGIRLPKHLARQVLEVFQKLNATPPGMLSSIILLAIYLGSGLATAVGIGVVIVARDSRSQHSRFAIFGEAKALVEPADIMLAGATNAADFDWQSPTVITTFTNGADAAAAYDIGRKQLHPGERLTLFGQSVFLAGTSNRPAWLRYRTAQTLTEYVSVDLSKSTAFRCLAPDMETAKNILQDCDVSLTAVGAAAWPPWADTKNLAPAQRDAIERFRHTIAAFRELEIGLQDDPQYLEGSSLRTNRSKKMTYQELNLAMEQDKKRRRQILSQKMSTLAGAGDTRLDKELIELYGKWLESPPEERLSSFKAMQNCEAWRLGALPLTNGLPALPEAWTAAQLAGGMNEQAEIQFDMLVFFRTECGLPAFVTWLQSQGCSNFRYGFVADDD